MKYLFSLNFLLQSLLDLKSIISDSTDESGAVTDIKSALLEEVNVLNIRQKMSSHYHVSCNLPKFQSTQGFKGEIYT